jgi:PmbA protein
MMEDGRWTMEDLRIFSRDILKNGLRRGCDLAEVYIKDSKGITVEVKDQKVEALKDARDFVVALRVMKGRRLGFSFVTDLKGIDKAVDQAIESTEWTAEDMYNDMPFPEDGVSVAIFDEDIMSLRVEDVIGHAMLLEISALSHDPRVKKVRRAVVSAGTGRTVIANSRGINVAYDSSYISAHTIALAEDGNDSQTGWAFASSRRKKDINLEVIGRDAAARAVELLGSKRIRSVKCPVILDSSVAVEFLDILSASLSAESVQKKKSMLAGKVGKSIISPLVEIVDDGTIPWAVGTMPVDDEGTPISKKTLISGGILNGYIHNTYTAKKDGVRSTGNAIRPSLQSLPGVETLNLYIKSLGGVINEFRDKALLKSLNRGVLVTEVMGLHTANTVSGDFSIGISGLWIEDGEPAYPVKEAVISGNILEIFKKVEAVGRDLRFYGDTGSPSLLIGEMDISG